MKKILIIEDDPAIAKIERDFLLINNFEVSIVADGMQGLQEALSGGYHLILLDLMLPGIDGLELCRKIRDKIDVPILMVTAKMEEADKIIGLGLGADDYITKPFSPTELVARVKANLAQHERSAEKRSQQLKRSEIKIGDIAINTLAHRVYLSGKEIRFKNKEYELLHFLMLNPERVYSREDLYERIWGMDAAGDSRTVSVHINRLREKIEKDPADPRYIETVWGAGYRFRP